MPILTLPQQKRLEQIVLQYRYMSGGVKWLVNSEDINPEVGRLDVTTEQLDEISSLTATDKVIALPRIRRSYYDGLRRRRVELGQEALTPLNDVQKQLIAELLGEPFNGNRMGFASSR